MFQLKHLLKSCRRGRGSVISHFKADLVSEGWLVQSVLLLCFFSSGLVDTVSFNTWSCFVGMQTGNTIFLALGVTGLPRSTHNQQWIKALTSIGSFFTGSFLFNGLYRWAVRGRKGVRMPRWYPLLSFLIQAACFSVATGLVRTGIVSSRPAMSGQFSSGSNRKGTVGVNLRLTNYVDLAPIGFLAFQSAAPLSLSRALMLNHMPTIVLTTTYHDLAANLWGLRESARSSSGCYDFLFCGPGKQKLRLLSVLALAGGSALGGGLLLATPNLEVPLIVCGTIRLAIGIGCLLLPSKKGSSDQAQSMPGSLQEHSGPSSLNSIVPASNNAYRGRHREPKIERRFSAAAIQEFTDIQGKFDLFKRYIMFWQKYEQGRTLLPTYEKD